MSKISKFLAEVIAEFKNISWPKKETIVQLTVVIVCLSIVISVILASFDFLFVRAIGLATRLRLPTPTSTPVSTPTPSTAPLSTISSPSPAKTPKPTQSPKPKKQ